MITHFHDNWKLTFGLILSLLLSITSYRYRFLNAGGAIATFVLGVIIFGIGGWKYALPILTFFILSSLLSKLGKKQKQKLSDKFQKSSQRDLWQVFANGGIAGIIVLLWNYFPHNIWYYLYLGAIAAANADTWATEIGVLSKAKPINILTFKPVPVGTSGGISLPGTLGAFLGSLVIAGFATFHVNNYGIVFLIVPAGFLGSLIDSFIGATIQGQFRCPGCQKITEKTTHCDGQVTKIISGLKWVDNDVVNGFCTFSGALFTLVGLKFLS